jgi:hypothetical protein
MKPPQLSGALMGGQLNMAPPPVITFPSSSDWEEFYCNCSPYAHPGPFAVAHVLFFKQAHKVIVHNWADIIAFQAAHPFGCGARLGGSKSNAINLILRLFLYHFLHTMSL